MTRTIRTSRLALVATVSLAVTVLVGCSAEEPAPAATPRLTASSSAPAQQPTQQPAQQPTQQPAGYPVCAPGEGKTVTDLPDVEIAAVVVPAVSAPAVTLDGVAVPARSIPGFTIPAHTVDAGCTVEYDAPGGCLGAVEISPVTIPPVTIPERVIPAFQGPAGKALAAVTLPAVSRSSELRSGERREQVCQVDRGGRIKIGVTRIGVTRIGVTRIGVTQIGATQIGDCWDGQCVAGVHAAGAHVPGVHAAGVHIPGASIPTRVLPEAPDVQVLPGKGRTSYSAPGDVLFATDKATLRPAAVKELKAIAKQLAKAPDDAKIIVEGHTDDRAEEGYNQTLSRRRAEAVTAWLAGAGIGGPRITTRGLGESAPAAPNTSAKNRRLNRRVVITVDAG